MVRGQERIFNCYGRQIKISANYDMCCQLHKMFHEKAVEYAEYYVKNCYDAYGGIKGFVENGRNDGLNILATVIKDLAITPAINDYAICTMDIQGFYDKYYYRIARDYNIYWEKVCNEVETKAAGIDSELQANIEYRKAQKDNRDRAVGMGFGMSGYIEAQIKAGAINMATGAAHGVFNFLGNTMDRMVTSSRRSKLYRESRSKLYDGIYWSIMLISRANFKFLADNGKVSFSDSQYGYEDRGNAEYKTFLKNFDMIKDDNVVMDAFAKMVLFNPNSGELYGQMYDRYGDKTGELNKLAKYFDVDVIEQKKAQYVDIIYSRIEPKLKVSEDEAKKAKITFISVCEQYGCLEIAEQKLEEIDKVLQDYDLKARTISNLICGMSVVCKTRESAEIARTEFTRIKTIIAGLNYEHTETDARKALELLKKEHGNLCSEVYTAYLEQLERLVNELVAKEAVARVKAVIAGLEQRTKETDAQKALELLKKEHDKLPSDVYMKYVKQLDNIVKERATKEAVARVKAVIAGLEQRTKEADAQKALELLKKEHDKLPSDVYTKYFEQLENIVKERATKAAIDSAESTIAGLDYEHIEADAQKALELLQKVRDKLPQEVYTEYVKKIENRLHVFDNTAKTVKGFPNGAQYVFDTRDEAEESWKTLRNIETLLAGLDYKNNVQDIAKAFELLKTCNCPTKASKKTYRLFVDILKTDVFRDLYKDYYPENKLDVIKDNLQNIPDDRYSEVYSLKRKSPKIAWRLSVFGSIMTPIALPIVVMLVGSIAILILPILFVLDRLYLRQIKLAVLKFVSLGGVGLWILYDWFKIKRITRDCNYQVLEAFCKQFANK